MNKIASYLRLIKNPALKDAVGAYMTYHWWEFTKVPASIRFHHTYTGGLMDHVTEVIDIGLGIIRDQELEDVVNSDHFIAAALIHDMGKVERYVWNEEEQSWGYSDKADLTDPHVVIVGRADHSLYPLIDFPLITGTPLPREVALAVLGHMGGYSVTSVKPDTLMEVILSAADYISSRLVRR